MSFEFKTLGNTDLKNVLDTFNESFSDYIIAIHLNIDQLSTKMSMENIDLNYSVGAFEDGKLVAFILHGKNFSQNKLVLYNGGTGVIPAKRGKNLTIKMYEFLIPTFKKLNVKQIQLEVISNNLPAIKSYKRIGFTLNRKLNCYKGNLHKNQVNNEISVKEIQNPNWNYLRSFWDTQPTWQNSIESISKLNNSLSIICGFKDISIIGYLVLNKTNNRILQIAIAKDQRKQRVGSTLIDYLIQLQIIQSTIINVDDNDLALNSFFIKLGFEKTLEQNEMILDLK